MAEQLGTLTRTHTCGALRATDVGSDVVLLGWTHKVRDLGSLLFIDVRDRDGHTQVIVEGNEALLERVKRLRSEYVIAVIGRVERRSADTTNANVPTGEVVGVLRHHGLREPQELALERQRRGAVGSGPA